MRLAGSVSVSASSALRVRRSGSREMPPWPSGRPAWPGRLNWGGVAVQFERAAFAHVLFADTARVRVPDDGQRQQGPAAASRSGQRRGQREILVGHGVALRVKNVAILHAARSKWAVQALKPGSTAWHAACNAHGAAQNPRYP
jgi:hypothetical protein